MNRLKHTAAGPDSTGVITAALRVLRAHRPEGAVLPVFALTAAAVLVLDGDLPVRPR